MRILITGGAGLLGRNLCDFFLKKGFHIVCMDNFSYSNNQFIIPLLDSFPVTFTFVNGDVENFRDCQIAASGIDYVFHFVSGGSDKCDLNLENEVNVNGLFNMIYASLDARVKRFIFISGSVNSFKLTENTDSIKLPDYQSLLDSGNLTIECIADYFKNTYNLNYIGIQMFNIFVKNQFSDNQLNHIILKYVRDFIEMKPECFMKCENNNLKLIHLNDFLRFCLHVIEIVNPYAINQFYFLPEDDVLFARNIIHAVRKILLKSDNDVKNFNLIKCCNLINVEFDNPHKESKSKLLLGYEPLNDLNEALEDILNQVFSKFNVVGKI